MKLYAQYFKASYFCGHISYSEAIKTLLMRLFVSNFAAFCIGKKAHFFNRSGQTGKSSVIRRIAVRETYSWGSNWTITALLY